MVQLLAQARPGENRAVRGVRQRVLAHGAPRHQTALLQRGMQDEGEEPATEGSDRSGSGDVRGGHERRADRSGSVSERRRRHRREEGASAARTMGRAEAPSGRRSGRRREPPARAPLRRGGRARARNGRAARAGDDYLEELLDIFFSKALEHGESWTEATLLDVANHKKRFGNAKK